MDVTCYAELEPFTTKDGSTIRELMHTPNQSLAEAVVGPGQSTERHYHARTEELYSFVEGGGELEIDGERRQVAAGRHRADSAGRPPHDHRRPRRSALSVLLRAGVQPRRHILRLSCNKRGALFK